MVVKAFGLGFVPHDIHSFTIHSTVPLIPPPTDLIFRSAILCTFYYCTDVVCSGNSNLLQLHIALWTRYSVSPGYSRLANMLESSLSRMWKVQQLTFVCVSIIETYALFWTHVGRSNFQALKNTKFLFKRFKRVTRGRPTTSNGRSNQHCIFVDSVSFYSDLATVEEARQETHIMNIHYSTRSSPDIFRLASKILPNSS